MDALDSTCADFAAGLHLEQQQDGFFIGRVQGFPIALKFVQPGEGTLLLFEVRHWLKADAPQLVAVAYDTETSQLLTRKQIEIEFDDHRGWLTINGGLQALESGSARRILDAVLLAWKNAGLVGDPDVCHYCRTTKVESVSYIERKLAQICPACLEQRRHKVAASAGAAEAVPIFLLTPFAACVSALLWAVFWAGHTYAFERLGVTRIWLPGGVPIVFFTAMFVGGPVGWTIKQNRRRGQQVAKIAAILFASAAVIGGEMLYLTWLIYRQVRFVSFSTALQIMPDYYLGNDPLFLGFKIINALCVVAAAELIAKPKAADFRL